MWLLATIQIAVASALATTFDDNIYLTAFFGEVDRRFRPVHVVVGELIGITALIGLALLGASFGVLFPRNVVGFLGVLPILIGLSTLLQRLQPSHSIKEPEAARSASGRTEIGRAHV